MANHGLVPRSLFPTSQFNWVYVVHLVVALILTIFFLFYFNRVFGSLLAYAVRTYTWHKYRIYIDVRALQISPLAGRIFFKGFRYHGHNETILINDGYITWRYWLRRVRETECTSSSQEKHGGGPGAQPTSGLGENGGKQSTNGLPCRIKAKVRGIEWFIYNRSPAYDSILESISSKQSPNVDADGVPLRKRAKLSKPNNLAEKQYRQHLSNPSETSWSSSEKHEPFKDSQSGQGSDVSPTTNTPSSDPPYNSRGTKQIDELPLILQILPIKLECSRGAIVMGNQHTRSVMTAKFDSAIGRIDAQKPSSPLDRYNQLIDLDFTHPVIQFRPNRSFTDSQHLEAGKGAVAKQTAEGGPNLRKPTDRQEPRFWSALRDRLPFFGSSDTSLSHKRVKHAGVSESNEGVHGEHRWLGLTRYIDEEDDLAEQERWKAVEYARFETIVDAPRIAISIHWDIPGQVSREAAALEDPETEVDINGGIPPDWGIDIRIRGGEVHYGPWADRQRTDLQNAFFPTLYKDGTPASSVPHGELRVSTIFKLVIEVEEATKLILHTREESKDWRWKDHATGEPHLKATTKGKKSRGKKKGGKANASPEIRPYGWLDLQVLPDSTVNFTMDLVARPNGYRNRIELDLRGPEMASSVNHELLWRSKSQTISCDLSNPLEWNSLRQWCINIQSDALEVFLLRDHIFLLTDLINDWSSSPPGDYYTFVPFRYLINLQLTDFRLYVNANDSNIINNPADLDDNTFVVVWGEHLDANLTIPLEHYQPSRNAVRFEVDARDGGFELRTPQWNTQHTFLKDSRVASLKELRIDGSYNYATSTSPTLTDTLIMQVHGDSPRIHLHGFLIRYLMKIKDNYFGEDLHFRTLEEYKGHLAANGEKGGDAAESTQHNKVSNDLDVILNLTADTSCAVLPSGLYSAAQGVTLDIASIRGDLRFTNYYMDLTVIFSPISLAYNQSTNWQDLPISDSSTQVFIEGLNLYGHRLFGLPPTEPTYVCNWDFDVGSVSGECTPQFLHGLLLGIRCFGFSFEDAENALPPLSPPVIHDVTFLRLKVQPILVWLRSEVAAFQLSMQSVTLNFDDWAGLRFSEKLTVCISNLVVAVIDDQGASRSRTKDTFTKTTQAYLEANVDVRMLTRKKMFEEARNLQQHHIRSQDVRTHRTPWLIHKLEQEPRPALNNHPGKIRQPAMQFPQMPEPISYAQGLSLYSSSTPSVSSRSGTSRRTSSRKSSFLVDNTQRVGRAGSISPNSISNPRNYSRELFQENGASAYASSSSVPERQLGSLAQLGLASPSPYRTPHFPLQKVNLDLGDVPVLPDSPDELLPVRNKKDYPVETQVPDQHASKSSIIINLGPSVRTFLTPMALSHTIDLLAELRLNTIDTLFDALQVDTMEKASKTTNSGQDSSAKTTEFHVCIPRLQAKLLSNATHHSPSLTNSSGLCMNFKQMMVTARMSQGIATDQPGASSHLTSIHASLDQISMSLITKTAESHHVQTLINSTICDIVLWSAISGRSSVGLNFKSMNTVAASNGLIDVLPSAFQTVTAIVETAQKMSQATERQELQLRLLVLAVVLAGEEIPDPPFLTRASYVLRSANNHLRTNDSWKLMARLRHILGSLPAVLQVKISDQCIAQPAASRWDAGDRVAASLEHWRGWDGAQVKQSLLMQKVYGNTREPLEEEPGVVNPLKVSVLGEGLELAVITGQGRNKVIMEKLEVAILHNQPAVANGGFIDPETFSVGDTMLQAHCTQITTSLDWDLSELIDVALKVPFDQLPSNPKQTPTAIEPIKKRKLHLVLSSDISIIDLISINLRAKFLLQGLRVSTLASQSASRSAANFLISADTATSEVQSHLRMLTVSKLRQPSVFCSTDNHIETAKKDQIWKVAASCDTVTFKVLEDPLLVIEVVDLVLRDEVTQALKLTQDIRSRINQDSPKTLAHHETASNKAHVTLCVDSYLLSLMILPSLIYSISGGIARTTVQHGISAASETLIDLDIQDHVHAFKTWKNETSSHIAAVQIPPINGRLSINLAPQQNSVIFHIIIDLIRLDASILHALLVTVSRPEISSLTKRIDDEIQVVQSHYQQLFKVTDHDWREKPSGSPILYDAFVIAAGLSVHASSPLSTTTAREGQLDFDLGCLQAKATNRDFNSGPALGFPEIEICLDSIQATLKRIEDGEKVSSGDIAIAAYLKCTSKTSQSGEIIRTVQVRSSKFEINMYAETAPIIIDIVGHLQSTLKTIDLTTEFKTLRSIRRPRMRSEVEITKPNGNGIIDGNDMASTALFGAMYSLEMSNIRLSWIIGSSTLLSPGREAEDLVLSFSKIDLSTKRDNAARLLIENFQLQMVPVSKAAIGRSQNSALLPEVVFNVAYLSTGEDRRLAFQAAGKSLDLRLNSQFILPASDLRRSIAFALQEVRTATADWQASAKEKGNQTKQLLGGKKFASILVDADFAGAVVYIEGRSLGDRQMTAMNMLDSGRPPQHGRYNQFTPDNASSSTTLRSPGLAFKIEYRNGGVAQESLNAEIKVDASVNILHPTVVPLIMEISSSVKEMVGESSNTEQSPEAKQTPPKLVEDNRLRSADPSAIFGKCRVNFGLRICRQEFSLSCQPIARVAATARFDAIYVTVNTVQSSDHGQFFTVSAVFKKPQASVQHAYSRESTGSLDVDTVFISLMSSKHVSAANGLSVILKISPMKVQINARQLQDVLLFREIWVPQEIRHSRAAPAPSPSTEPHAFMVQRYQQVATASAFPWNATVSVAQLDVQLDLGQSLGRSTFNISNFWVSSKKTSDWEQNLCLGFERVGMDATGRMSGLIELQNFRVRTSIQWPMEDTEYQTPLVQASLGFDHLRVKAAFDYQAFVIMNITTVDFMMYNVRNGYQAAGDRLVAVVEGDKVQVFCTAISASQGLALYQAIQRLIEEKQAAYETSLKDIERFLRRRSAINPPLLRPAVNNDSSASDRKESIKVPIRLQTNVVVKLHAVNTGVFPSTFFDNQILKLEAKDASARFSVALEGGKVHSTLGMTLGQLRVALSGAARPSTPKKVGEVSIDEVVASATASRGGLILGVPRTLVNMHIWQRPESNHIDYIFRSSFEGNIDIGWNYSRISFIRGMHSSHVRALAQRLGKPLPQSAVQITGGPRQDGEDDIARIPDGGQEKITAVVNVPQSKYEYTALEPALVDTPQLRNLGEATPPLEWIGLHRERLPNLTHQIVIVSLLEVAKEVEDAYTKILGSS